jgi:hypothetical protein
MAKKKMQLAEDLATMDFMQIVAGGDSTGVFSKNELVDYSYPTGISVIDYAFGYEINVKDENGEFVKKRTMLGLQAGSFNVVSGRTQSYKTTMVIQMASNIAYSNQGNVIHYDTECRLVTQRVKTLSKLPDDWFDADFPRYKFKSGAISFETLKADITELYENRMRHKDLLLKDTGEVDPRNRPIYLMPPTVVIIDSLQNVIVKDIDVEDKDFDKMKELRSNTQGARSAYTIRGLLTDILPMMKEANIIVLCIAHKTANIQLQGIGGAKKQFQYGANDERISGGSAVEFNASAVINLTGEIRDDSRFHEDTDGFEGNTVLFEPTKASTNESGNKRTGLGFSIIVDKRKEGVDNIRTLIQFLNDRGRLKGNKAGYTVIDSTGAPVGERFSWKKAPEDLKAKPDTFKAFLAVAKEELEKLVSKAPVDVAGTIEPFNIDRMLTQLSISPWRVLLDDIIGGELAA